jgi:hypothetical protein
MIGECKSCKGTGYKVVRGVYVTKQTLEKHGITETPKGKTFYFCGCSLGQQMEQDFRAGYISIDLGDGMVSHIADAD